MAESKGSSSGNGGTKKKKKKAAATAAAPTVTPVGTPTAHEQQKEAKRLSTPLTESQKRRGVSKVPGATFAERSKFSASGVPPQQREAVPQTKPTPTFTREGLQQTGKYTPEAINELFEAVERVAPDLVGTPFNPNPEVSADLTQLAGERGGGGKPSVAEILKGEGELGVPGLDLQGEASFWDKLSLGIEITPTPAGKTILGLFKPGAAKASTTLGITQKPTLQQGLKGVEADFAGRLAGVDTSTKAGARLGVRYELAQERTLLKFAKEFQAALKASQIMKATGGLSAPKVAESAAARRARIVSGIGKPDSISTRTARKMWSYLTKITARAKKPDVVLALIGTGLYTSLFWAPNEKGDAMTTLSIVQKEALRNEDYETVLAIGESMREANEIQATLPVSGFWKAEKSKFKASITASETYEKAAIKAMQEQTQEPEGRGLSPGQL